MADEKLRLRERQWFNEPCEETLTALNIERNRLGLPLILEEIVAGLTACPQPTGTYLYHFKNTNLWQVAWTNRKGNRQVSSLTDEKTARKNFEDLKIFLELKCHTCSDSGHYFHRRIWKEVYCSCRKMADYEPVEYKETE